MFVINSFSVPPFHVILETLLIHSMKYVTLSLRKKWGDITESLKKVIAILQNQLPV